MTTGAGKIALASRAMRTALALAQSEALVQLGYSYATSGPLGPVGTITTLAAFTPKQTVNSSHHPQILIRAMFNGVCSAASTDITMTLARNGVTIAVWHVDSGASANHNVQFDGFVLIPAVAGDSNYTLVATSGGAPTLTIVAFGAAVLVQEWPLQNLVPVT